MASTKSSLGYKETDDALTIRIEAHKNYSNFNLEDWISEHIPLAPGSVMLDIGCGNGNLFPTYDILLHRKGVIIGIDQSEELLQAATRVRTGTPSVLLRWDLNDPLPFLSGTFDLVISTFAIYYTDDPSTILQQIHRVLKPGSHCYLIGPSDRNAAELYAFNKAIFGFGRDEKVVRRSRRLEDEFLPAARHYFSEVGKELIHSRLSFPSAAEFIRYYRATLLFEESLKRSGRSAEAVVLEPPRGMKLELSKEMIALWMKK